MSLPLILYLRPFTSDGKVMVSNPEKSSIWRNVMPTSSNGTLSQVTLEELVLQSVADLGLLIAIGKTVEIVGAGKVVAGESEWKEYFVALSMKAPCIVSVPSMHPSTLWEIDWLADHGFYDKMVFVFTDLHFSEKDVAHFDNRTVRQHLSSKGWAIPNALTSSTLLSFSSGGATNAAINESKHKKRHVRAQIQRVVEQSVA